MNNDMGFGASGLNNRNLTGKPGGGWKQMLRPNSDRYIQTVFNAVPVRRHQSLATKIHPHFAIFMPDRGIQHVHRRRTDEARHKNVVGTIIKFERRPDLLNIAGLHHHDSICHRHGLNLIMGYVNRCGLKSLVQLPDFRAHLHPELCVEIGQWFIEKKNLRVPNDCPPHGDALPLTTRKCTRIPIQIWLESQDLRSPVYPLRYFRLADLPHAQCKCHVGCNSLVRIERVVLKNHCNVTLRRRQIVNHAISDRNPSGSNVLKSCNHSKQG